MNVLYLIKKLKIFFSQALLRRSRLKFALNNTNTIAKVYRNHTNTQCSKWDCWEGGGYTLNLQKRLIPSYWAPVFETRVIKLLL